SIEVQEKLKTFKDPRVIYVQQERHVNGAAARNRGISESKGEYVAFLDDDDTWIKEKLEKQIETFEKNPEIGLVTTGVYYNYINENVIYESIPNAVGDVSKKILISNCVGGTQAMVKKSI